MSYGKLKDTTLYWEGVYGRPARKIKSQKYNVQKKTAKHYVLALDYYMLQTETTSYSGRYIVTPPPYHPPLDYGVSDPVSVSSYVPSDMDSYGNADLDRSTNKAYAKFVAKMKDSAQNANNFLEMGQSMQQIMSHVTSIAKSIQAVKKGDIVGAAKALGVSVSGNRADRIKKRAKQASDRWLELHFGWEPLVQDIGSSIDILQGTGQSSSTNAQHIRVGSTFTGTYAFRVDNSDSSGYEVFDHRYRWSGGTRMGGITLVDNPNLAIANQMGFVNPLSVAWEAVPFSFVADWFGNVGQCLGAMTDFLGFQLKDGWTTTLKKTDYSRGQDSHLLNPYVLIREEAFSVRRIEIKRTGGISSPVFRLTPFKGFSPARGATAVSLLVQQMGKL
jgi:hypothetical protein